MITAVIADDEKWVLRGIRQMLEQLEIPVQVVGTAENGIEATELLLRLKPDLLITDIQMPGIDGLNLMEKMRECGIYSKVIFVSGYAEFEYAQRACHLGATDYLLKPLNRQKVGAAIEKVRQQLEQEKKDNGIEIFRQEFLLRTHGSWGEGSRPHTPCVYQCIEVETGDAYGENPGAAFDRTEQEEIFWFALKRKKNRLAVFVKYPDRLSAKEMFDILEPNFSPCLAAGVSCRTADAEQMGRLLDEANIALISSLFCGGGCLEYKERGENGERIQKYLDRAGNLQEKKSRAEWSILLEDLEKDTEKKRIFADQLLLIYNHIVAGLNTAGFGLEYFNLTELEERFGTANRFFSYVRKAVLEKTGQEESAPGSLLYSIVMRVKAENVRDLEALGSLAEKFCVSSSYLSNLLRKELGMPYSEYVTEKRIQKARELLLDSRLSVDEVAEQVGYKDYFYFCKVFKKCVGSSPSKYRREMEEKLLPK
ncbi:MAG: response regulator [Eubacteriales bacterium]|nr:response regulator [Eubacteriales bacterium]